jgi:hypothetical protein
MTTVMASETSLLRVTKEAAAADNAIAWPDGDMEDPKIIKTLSFFIGKQLVWGTQF